MSLDDIVSIFLNKIGNIDNNKIVIKDNFFLYIINRRYYHFLIMFIKKDNNIICRINYVDEDGNQVNDMEKEINFYNFNNIYNEIIEIIS